MIKTLENGLNTMRAKLAEVAGQPLYVAQFASGLCIKTDGDNAGVVGPAFCTVFDNAIEAERVARQIKNGNHEKPHAIPYELALKASIEQTEQTIATLKEWEKRGK